MDDEALDMYLGLLLQAGCVMRGRTILFDKPYVWMTDPRGTYFLERIPA